MNSLIPSLRRAASAKGISNINGFYKHSNVACLFSGPQHRLYTTQNPPPSTDSKDLLAGIPIITRPTTGSKLNKEKEPLTDQANTAAEIEEREKLIAAGKGDTPVSLTPEAEEEVVTEEQMLDEYKQNVRTLWEAYATEDFNLETLLGEKLHGEKDLRKEKRPSHYYYYTPQELKTYLPEGLAGGLPKMEHAKFSQKGLMVRPIVEDVISWMDGWRQKSFVGRSKPEDYHIILDGPRGAGKSTLLNPIAHWARMQGWIVVFIPDGIKWSGTDNLEQSRVDITTFDQLNLAKTWCAQMLGVHGDKFKKIPLRTKFSIGGEEGSPEFKSSSDKTLHDLLSWPLKHDREAADAVWHFRRELCTVHEYPIAIVADGVNAFHAPSVYSDPLDPYIFSQNLPAKRLVLTKSFCEFENHGIMNGLYIGTTTANISRKYELRKAFPKANIVNVPAYTREEVQLVVDHYKQNGHFAQSVTTQTSDYLWAATSGNPRDLWKQSLPM